MGLIRNVFFFAIGYVFFLRELIGDNMIFYSQLFFIVILYFKLFFMDNYFLMGKYCQFACFFKKLFNYFFVLLSRFVFLPMVY